MKRLLLLLIINFCFLSIYSQYYYIPEIYGIGENPGGLNTDNEYPVGSGLSSSWTEILDSTANPQWSPVQTIPFTFNFNGGLVTDYKVSSSGILTFTTSAVTVPSFTNAGLPDASIPDASICVWGIEGSGSNDAIATKTFGTAPNRQHWILFTSYTSGSSWTYWSIVLEETTNKIYIVDQRHSDPNGLSLSLGIQINSTTAISVTGSPNVSGFAESEEDPSDNAYYEFVYGSQPSYDLRVVSSEPTELVIAGSNTIEGTIVNQGSATITSFDINYTVDGGSPVTSSITGVNIAPYESYDFTHPTNWDVDSGGVTYDLCLYADNINSGNADENPGNDELCSTLLSINGNSGYKRVLIEEFTTTACGFCPDGHLKLDSILNENPGDIIGVCHHAGYGTDSMTIPEHETYADIFASGAPTAAIDRGENIGLSRSTWRDIAVEQLAKWTPCDVNITGSYNQVTRDLSATVGIDFTDYGKSSSYRITMFIVEDSVNGTGSGWDQSNYYNSDVGHPMEGLGNPIVGYMHNHVVREVFPLTTAWGVYNIISNNPQPNDQYSFTFNGGIDPSWDENNIKLVAFVSYFNSDVTKRDILNVFEVDLLAIPSGKNEISKNNLNANIYPNPTNEYFWVDMESEDNVIIEICDLYGKQIIYKNFTNPDNIMISTNELPNGIYLVNIITGNSRSSKKLIISK